MPSFEEIGLREELLRTLEEEDVAEPTALQEAVIPALRRGGNLVARASSGSGKTLAYALGVFDRLAGESDAGEEGGEEGPRVLVLAPTAAEAERAAAAMIPYVQSIGLSIAALGGGWATPTGSAEVLAGTPADVMDAVKAAAIKLHRLEAVVVDGAAAIEDLGGLERVDGLIDLVPRDAQRILISSALSDAIEDLAERRVKRALRYPAEAAIPSDRETPAGRGGLAYVVAAEGEKLGLLAAQLRGRDAGSPPPIVFCRSDERAADLAAELMSRGFLVGGADDEEADVTIAAAGASRAELAEDLEGEAGQSISYDVPADARALRERHAGDPDAVVLVDPRQLGHLREIARQAGFEVTAAPQAGDRSGAARELRDFREQVRKALREEDLTAQLLVLEPLLEEYSPAEVAAALAGMVRTRRPQQAAGADAPRQAAPAAPAVDPSPPAGPPPATWARLYVSVGSRDDIRPGDLVGGLAGEAGIPGSRIGKIEIRDSFSIVEVQADVADQVIRAVNGTTIKGRSVRVDYDRGGPAKRPPGRGGPGSARGGPSRGGPPRGGPPRGGGSPRRTTRKPPAP